MTFQRNFVLTSPLSFLLVLCLAAHNSPGILILSAQALPNCNGKIALDPAPCGDPSSCYDDVFENEASVDCDDQYDQESLEVSDECLDFDEEEYPIMQHCQSLGQVPCMTERPCIPLEVEEEANSYWICSSSEFIGPPAPFGDATDHGDVECEPVY